MKFEAYTLEDMEKLYKEGMIAKSPEETHKKMQEKKKKFIRGNKDFVFSEFKTNWYQ